MEFYVKRKSSSSNKTIKHSDDELQHHGILGMKWGVRRYQNSDGSYTQAGKERYGKSNKSQEKNVNSFSKKEQKENASKYWKLSSSERVDSPIGKELLSGDSYKKFASSLKKQEEIETRDLKDKSSDLYKAAHQVAEEYKKKAGDNFNRETYKYYDEIGGIDAQSKILTEYAKFSKEYAKAEKEWQDAVNNLYEESKALSNKYFGKHDALTRQDVIELAYDKMDKEDS